MYVKHVKKCKRQYWYKLQCECELLEAVEYDPNHFWKTLEKNGMASTKNITHLLKLLMRMVQHSMILVK